MFTKEYFLQLELNMCPPRKYEAYVLTLPSALCAGVARAWRDLSRPYTYVPMCALPLPGEVHVLYRCRCVPYMCRVR